MHLPDYEVIASQADGTEWITLLHGASQHRGLFNRQREYFRTRYRLLLIDLPGHGGSSHWAGPCDQVAYARAVATALDAAGVQRTHLWGTHTGAAVGLLIASSQPERIASLVLEGAVLPGMPMPYTNQVIARARTTMQERGVAAAIDEWFNACAWFDVIRNNPRACRANAHLQLLRAFGGAPWRDASSSAAVPSLVDSVQRLPHPTLLVNGEFDVAEFVAVADMLASKMPRAQRAVVAGAGGFPLWEFPAIVNRLVDDFLSGQHADAELAAVSAP